MATTKKCSRGKSAARAMRGKPAAKRKPKGRWINPLVFSDEEFARNIEMDWHEGDDFAVGEQVNIAPDTGRVVKAGTPDSIPLGEVTLVMAGNASVGGIMFIYTCEDYYRNYTLTGKGWEYRS